MWHAAAVSGRRKPMRRQRHHVRAVLLCRKGIAAPGTRFGELDQQVISDTTLAAVGRAESVGRRKRQGRWFSPIPGAVKWELPQAALVLRGPVAPRDSEKVVDAPFHERRREVARKPDRNGASIALVVEPIGKWEVAAMDEAIAT